jgi:hypothetical protein
MNNRKFQLIGEFTLGTDEDLYYRLNRPETDIETNRFKGNYDKRVINIVNNGKQYIREKNPYDHIVNLNTQKYNSSSCFSFKARSFYNKAVDYSKKSEKMDKYNPIYFHVYNPNENRYYKFSNIY